MTSGLVIGMTLFLLLNFPTRLIGQTPVDSYGLDPIIEADRLFIKHPYIEQSGLEDFEASLFYEKLSIVVRRGKAAQRATIAFADMKKMRSCIIQYLSTSGLDQYIKTFLPIIRQVLDKNSQNCFVFAYNTFSFFMFSTILHESRFESQVYIARHRDPNFILVSEMKGSLEKERWDICAIQRLAKDITSSYLIHWISKEAVLFQRSDKDKYVIRIITDDKTFLDFDVCMTREVDKLPPKLSKYSGLELAKLAVPIDGNHGFNFDPSAYLLCKGPSSSQIVCE